MIGCSRAHRSRFRVATPRSPQEVVDDWGDTRRCDGRPLTAGATADGGCGGRCLVTLPRRGNRERGACQLDSAPKCPHPCTSGSGGTARKPHRTLPPLRRGWSTPGPGAGMGPRRRPPPQRNRDNTARYGSAWLNTSVSIQTRPRLKLGLHYTWPARIVACERTASTVCARAARAAAMSSTSSRQVTQDRLCIAPPDRSTDSRSPAAAPPAPPPAENRSAWPDPRRQRRARPPPRTSRATAPDPHPPCGAQAPQNSLVLGKADKNHSHGNTRESGQRNEDRHGRPRNLALFVEYCVSGPTWPRMRHEPRRAVT